MSSLIVTIAVLVWASMGWGAADAGVEVSDPSIPPPADGDFSDFLVGQSLVVEGTVVAVDDVQRATMGGCGLPSRIEGRGWDVVVRISRVRFGTAEDSTVIISTLAPWSYPSGAMRPGALVLAWAFRNCRDGWRLWGGLVVVTRSGHLIGHDGSDDLLRLKGTPRGQPVAWTSLDSALAAKASRNGIASFAGKAGVGLVRVASMTRTSIGGYTFTCDSLQWVLGDGGAMPVVVDVLPQPSCYADVQVGDSLMVPIPADFNGTRLELDACPSAFQVKEGFARGLGVPLRFVTYALKIDQQGIAVRPFVAKE